jgi:hypothetical protein
VSPEALNRLVPIVGQRQDRAMPQALPGEWQFVRPAKGLPLI